MWYFFFLLAHLLQPISYFLILRQIRSKKSVAGLSCDFTLLSWISSITSAASGLAYAFLLKIQMEYSNRYPLYPDLQVSLPVLVLDLVTLLVTSTIMVVVFVTYRKTIIGAELISLPTKALIAVVCSFFLWLFTLYIRGRATINELDLADCAWTIGTICFGVRFISQLTNNYFLERYYHFCRNFIIWQVASMGLAGSGWFISRRMGLNWHQIPGNVMHELVLGPNIVFLFLLLLQAHVMGKLSPRYRALP